MSRIVLKTNINLAERVKPHLFWTGAFYGGTWMTKTPGYFQAFELWDLSKAIGREKARELNAKRPLRGQQSYGMRITSDRINIINKLYNSNTSVRIIDLKDQEQNPLGTRVELCIPI